MVRKRSKRQPVGPQPKKFLMFAESWSNRMRKQLCLMDHSVPTGEAEKILALIAILARKGRNAPAMKAREFAGKVEILVDLARTELTALLRRREQDAD